MAARLLLAQRVQAAVYAAADRPALRNVCRVGGVLRVFTEWTRVPVHCTGWSDMVFLGEGEYVGHDGVWTRETLYAGVQPAFAAMHKESRR